MGSRLDHTELVELLNYTQAQLGKIRVAVAASDHAGAMLAIDCLVGAAAEQTKCKLASLGHAGMPIGKDGPIDDGPSAEKGTIARFRAWAARPAAGKARMRGSRPR
jgi:hypothetical protein